METTKTIKIKERLRAHYSELYMKHFNEGFTEHLISLNNPGKDIYDLDRYAPGSQSRIVYDQGRIEAMKFIGTQNKALKMDLENIKDRLKSHSEYIEGFAKKVLRESEDIGNIIG